MVHFENVAIIGVGLIGGSLARVMKARGIAGSVTGSGRSRETLERALRLGIIDSLGQGPAGAVANADLVVLATPVGAFVPLVREIAAKLKPGAILTDVGSVKGGLVGAIEGLLPAGVHFVPGHPIAGRERHGIDAASESLFLDAKCILTPTEHTGEAALDAIRQLWTAAGSTVIVMSPDQHDQIFAAVSHLPHVAAFALMTSVAELGSGDGQYLKFSGAGFRDFTRIAASSPEMWRDICMENSRNIVAMIDRYLFSLNRMKKAIKGGDAARIEGMFRKASDIRRGMS